MGWLMGYSGQQIVRQVFLKVFLKVFFWFPDLISRFIQYSRAKPKNQIAQGTKLASLELHLVPMTQMHNI